MPRPVKARAGSVFHDHTSPDLRRGWVVGLDILWDSDDHELYRAVEVYGESWDEVKERSEWVLGAIHAAMDDEQQQSESHSFVPIVCMPRHGAPYESPSCRICGAHRSQHHEEES